MAASCASAVWRQRGDGVAPMIMPVGVSLAGLAVAWSVLVEPRWLQRVDLTLRHSALPAEMDGLRILHITDTHTTRIGQLERRLLALAGDWEHDLLLLTGDLTNPPKGLDAVTALLSRIAPRIGGFACPGNAEHKDASSLDQTAAALQTLGIQMLTNAHATAGDALYVAGVDDPKDQRDQLERVMPPEGGAFRILLAHSPDILQRAGTEAFHLILSGHTHGGQVRFPIIGAPVNHTRIGRSVASGLLDAAALTRITGRTHRHTLHYISRGVGTVGRGPIWLRFNCRPEVTCITLRRDTPNQETTP